MRTTALLLALVALATATAVAQVPRTINYQGRMNGPDGPLEGTRTMTLKLYAAATGGTVLFAETQTVTFRNGIFTVAIGGATPGAIPASVPFDSEYWLGVSVAGFNGGQEIAPRFQLRSSPYSLRAATADVADVADSSINAAHAEIAATVELPLYVSGGVAENPLFEARNTAAAGTGIRAEGTTYASVSIGVDSTSRHFVAGETAGTLGTPVPGGYYRDNAPLAWGTVGANGSVIGGFGMTSSFDTKDSTYTITLVNKVQTSSPTGTQIPQIAVMITPGGAFPPGEDLSPVFTQWKFKRDSNSYSSSEIIVKFTKVAQQVSSSAVAPFSIVIFGRP